MEIGQAIILILVAAFLAEAIWETLKMIWQPGKLVIDRVGALVVGILIALVFGLNLFTILGFTVQWPALALVGVVLTGILLSRGSNFIHDLLKAIITMINGTSGSIISGQLEELKIAEPEPLKCPFAPALQNEGGTAKT